MTYNTEKVEENVVWNTEGIDFSKAGTYTVEELLNSAEKSSVVLIKIRHRV